MLDCCQPGFQFACVIVAVQISIRQTAGHGSKRATHSSMHCWDQLVHDLTPPPLQARYSKSVEGVVGALVDDTVALNKSTRQVEGLVKHQQSQLQDTKEALLR